MLAAMGSPLQAEISAVLDGDGELGEALLLYRAARHHARCARLVSALLGRPLHLLDLREAQAHQAIAAGYYRGVQAVPLGEIRGSESRASDFDAGFYPLERHTEERWLSVAIARRRGIALPAVVLLQVGDTYFVRDGHHRVSVAKALGDRYIDAAITVWQGERSTGTMANSQR